MNFFINSQKINQLVRPANNILIAIHQNPDADALGSLLAINEWLDSLGKQYTNFCAEFKTKVVDFFLFDYDSIISDPNDLIKQEYDLLIVLDSGDLKHAGLVEILPRLSFSSGIINIDHHATNKNFGEVNLVNAEAVSTTEIIYQLFRFLKIDITPKIATALLAGIIYDTYSFTNPNTTYNCLETASVLLLSGARLPAINDSILKNKTVGILKLWGKVLARLSRNDEFNIVTTVITQNDLQSQDKPEEVTDGIANFLNNLSDVNAVLILQQQENGLVKGSLRTNNDLIDVSNLAKILGGGGHRKAAGFSVAGELIRDKDGLWKIV